MEKTKVIFRKLENCDIIAIFPELCGTNNYNTCLSYEHFGQHGSCCIDYVLSLTESAKENEYNALKAELDSIGYDLEIIKRNRRKFTETRIKKLNEIK